MSGTFYHAPAPGEPAFVKVGDKVTKGQVIGIIEAMKLMNEIEVCPCIPPDSTQSVHGSQSQEGLDEAAVDGFKKAFLQADASGTIVEFIAANGSSVAPGQVGILTSGSKLVTHMHRVCSLDERRRL